jgi:hypothetical protein
MKKEYPTTPDEAFETSNAGAIYAKYIATARAEGRILDFEYEPNEPVVCSWDLGVSDYTSIWAVQFVGREIHWLDFYEASGEPVSHFAGVMREWDRKYNNISMHYLPHDAGYRDKNAMTYVQHLSTCGINNVTVVPRTPDIWLGVNNLRDMLKRSLLHKTNCGTPRVDSVGTEHPSGIDCLEGYRTKGVDAAGMVSEMPLHDETSHACFPPDALVSTPRGEVPISEVSEGDLVNTPLGPRRVEFSGQTGEEEVWEFDLSDGRKIRCTPDHPVYTSKGFARANTIRLFSEVWTEKTDLKPSLLKVSNTADIKTITSPPRLSARSIVTSIVRYGQTRMARYLRGITSIISTATRSITGLKIWSASPQPSTCPSMPKTASGSSLVAQRPNWTRSDISPSIGTDPMRGERGTPITRRSYGSAGSPSRRSAITAAKPLRPNITTSNSVVVSVNSGNSMGSTQPPHLGGAIAATSLRSRLLAALRSIARPNVNGVGCVRRRNLGRSPVYNLTVEEAHCYYVGGVLVSNCDAARTLAEAFSRGMVGKDGSTPGLRREGGFRPRVITGAGGVSSVANNRRRAIR